MRSSFARCLAEVAGVAVHEVPLPDDGEDPVDAVRPWLAGRGLGLVPLADPAAFAWPGAWVARLADGRHVVRFGVPSGTIHDPQGGEETEVVAGWVLAPHRPTLWTPPAAPVARDGVLEAILLAPSAGAPVTETDAVRALPGRGLEGDRYAIGAGTFPSFRTGAHVTLCDPDLLARAGVTPREARRNLVVRGADVEALVGRRFRVGEVEMIGRRPAEPCAHLARLLGRPETLRALVGRGGLRADVLTEGTIHPGDPVVALD